MEGPIITNQYIVRGMTCSGCEEKIGRILGRIEGVMDARADYANGLMTVRYDGSRIDPLVYETALSKAGYSLVKRDSPAPTGAPRLSIIQFAAIAVILASLYLIIQNTVGFAYLPEMTPSMGYGVLLVVGLLTSLHCVAMCGGITLSQCVAAAENSGGNKNAGLKTSAMYNLGRIISYTLIGGLAGALGSAVSLSGWARGSVAIASGLFMIIMGINLSGVFPAIGRFAPRVPRVFRRLAGKAGTGKGPLAIGLLNGMMPCGPLQAMQLYALGTGSFYAGAISMFFFSLGTVPLMLGLGAASAMLGGRFTGGMMKLSAVLVLLLGLIMLQRGLLLSGIAI